MLAFLLLNWRSVLACVATATICYGLHWISATYSDMQHQTAMTELRTSLLNDMHDAQTRTEKASHEHLVKITALNKQLASIKRVRADAGQCVKVVGLPAVKPAGTPGSEVAPVEARLPAGLLLDDAAEDERTRLRLIDLQAFVCGEYKAHGTDLPGCIR